MTQHEKNRAGFWEAAAISALSGAMQFGPDAAAKHAITAADKLAVEWDQRNPEQPETAAKPAPAAEHHPPEQSEPSSTFARVKQQRGGRP